MWLHISILFLILCANLALLAILLNPLQRTVSSIPLLRSSNTFQSVMSSDSAYVAWDNVSNHKWMDQIPVNSGFVLERTSSDDRQWSSVSMFHQLHCLIKIRQTIHKLVLIPGYSESFMSGVSKWSYSNHIGHCFDYIRQGLLCSGDDTLLDLTPNTHDEMIKASHICKDSKWVYDWAERSGRPPLPQRNQSMSMEHDSTSDGSDH